MRFSSCIIPRPFGIGSKDKVSAELEVREYPLVALAEVYFVIYLADTESTTSGVIETWSVPIVREELIRLEEYGQLESARPYSAFPRDKHSLEDVTVIAMSDGGIFKTFRLP